MIGKAGRWMRRLGVGLAAAVLILVFSPTAAFACGLTYEEAPTIGDNSCGGPVPVVGAAVVGVAALATVATLTMLSFMRGAMSAADFNTVMTGIALAAQPHLAAELAANPTLPPSPATRSLAKIRAIRDFRLRWEGSEEWTAQVNGLSGEKYFPVAESEDPDFPVTGGGGRFVDVPVELPDGRILALEVKMYKRFRTVALPTGEKVTVEVQVPLRPEIIQQINKDVAIRRDNPNYDPRWIFLGAGPSPGLAQYLTKAGIVYIVIH